MCRIKSGRTERAAAFSAALAAVCQLACAAWGLESLTVETGGVQIELSAQETLLTRADAMDGGLSYFPDTASALLSRRPLRLLVTAGTAVYLFEGEDMRSLRAGAQVLAPGRPGEFDNGYAGVCGVHRFPDGTLYAVYHAEDHEGMADVGPGVPGYYAQIGSAVSMDGGVSFVKTGVALRSRQAKEPGGMPDQGAGEACLTLGRGGGFLLLYYVDHSRAEGRGVQICVARASIQNGRPPAPEDWQKWRGGAFSEPGMGGLDDPVMSGLNIGADATFPHVVWMPALERYVMFFNMNAWREYAGDNPPMKPFHSGIYASTSENGIDWTMPAQIMRTFSVAVPYKELAWHPALIMDDPNRREGWLIYGYSPRWHHLDRGGEPHFMAGRRVRFHRQ